MVLFLNHDHMKGLKVL